MMHLFAETLDDLMMKVFQKILKSGERVNASKGWNTELSGVVLELKNPLARLSRTETKGTAFSCLGETLWYLAKSNRLDFIEYYLSNYHQFAEADGTIHGAYGPRLFGMRGGIDQIKGVTELLKRKPSSRQAVIQLFNAEDLLKPYKDIPCTCTLQFFVRKGALYGGLGEGVWTWRRVSSNVTSFRDWLERHEDALRPYRFSNHRKYQSLSARSRVGTGAVVASYVSCYCLLARKKPVSPL